MSCPNAVQVIDWDSGESDRQLLTIGSWAALMQCKLLTEILGKVEDILLNTFFPEPNNSRMLRLEMKLWLCIVLQPRSRTFLTSNNVDSGSWRPNQRVFSWWSPWNCYMFIKILLVICGEFIYGIQMKNDTILRGRKLVGNGNPPNHLRTMIIPQYAEKPQERATIKQFKCTLTITLTLIV